MSNELAISSSSGSMQIEWYANPEKIALLKRTYAKGCTDDEFELFMAVASQSGLNPFARQIYAIKRYDHQTKSEVMTPQVSIEGLRLTAERCAAYQGQTAPEWCGKDGEWKDIWLDSDPPAGARVGVYREDRRDPIWGVVLYSEVCQRKKDGSPTKFWKDAPANQLSKCAEAAAIRRAFPQYAGKLYIDDEMPAVEVEAEIVEEPRNKWVDAGPKPKQESIEMGTPAQRKGLYAKTSAMIKDLGWDEENSRQFLHGLYGEYSRKNLNLQQLEDFVFQLEQTIEKVGVNG